ncbi:MAG: hypothetical protein KA508_00365 [Gammaproteobacteria bacterium]|nr:hypothetical protein [Gammaproteobacteria bacterium]
MKASDITFFSDMMMVIAALYHKPFTDKLTDIYWESLEEFSLEEVSEALRLHVRDTEAGRFFPKPADIVRFIEGSSESRALQAWTKVERAFSQVGRYQSLAFDDPLIHAVIQDMGGWIKLCEITLKELPFCCNEFQKRYRGFLNRKPLDTPPYLPGIVERDNAKDGYPIPAPVLLGDQSKSQALITTKPSESLKSDQRPSIEHLIKAVFKAQQRPEEPDDK